MASSDSSETHRADRSHVDTDRDPTHVPHRPDQPPGSGSPLNAEDVVFRRFSTAVLVAGAVLLSASARPEIGTMPDPELFESAGCSSCHGPTAAGAFGPTLAATSLTFEDFLHQLRAPRGVMPSIPESLVSDEQARDLYDYVSRLDEPEGGPVAGSACSCGHHGRGHHRHGRGMCRSGACNHGHRSTG